MSLLTKSASLACKEEPHYQDQYFFQTTNTPKIGDMTNTSLGEFVDIESNLVNRPYNKHLKATVCERDKMNYIPDSMLFQWLPSDEWKSKYDQPLHSAINTRMLTRDQMAFKEKKKKQKQ